MSFFIILLLAMALVCGQVAQAQKYDSRGKRDPFFRLQAETGSHQDPLTEAPLQMEPDTLAALTIEQVSVAGLAFRGRTQLALLKGNGPRTYLAPIGSKLRDGEVLEFSPASVTFIRREDALRVVKWVVQPSPRKHPPSTAEGPSRSQTNDEKIGAVRESLGPKATARLVSLKLVEASLSDFFRVVSELDDLNLLIDPDIEGTLTLHVQSVPMPEILETVLNSYGLEKTTLGRIERISKRETRDSERKAKQLLEKTEPLEEQIVTRAKQLNYTSGKEIVNILKNHLSKRGQLHLDERTNTLSITDIADKVEQIDGLAARLDEPELQVEIEARIIQASTSFVRELGTRLGLLLGSPGSAIRGTLNVTVPAQQPLATAGITIGQMLNTTLLDAMLSAAETRGDVRILSRPRVSTLSNSKAIITQGARIPIPVQENFTTTVRFETAALRLVVTPTVTREDTIVLKIRVENNVPDFTRTVLGIPTILTSESQTVVLLPNAGTTVIGGIYLETEREQQQQVPGLGKIPIMGVLFRRNFRQRETQEILFFITARIRETLG